MVQMKDEWLHLQLKYAILYIPHGSDESESESESEKEAKRLYIPHGSDESSR